MIWGLVGASMIASEWMIAAVRGQHGGSVAAVVSADPARGAAYAERHAIARAEPGLDALLADPQIEAVYVSTTNEKHRAQALAAIEAGKHVLCEKPLALGLADAAAMVRAATAAGVVLATNHHLRNAGSHRAIREIVQAGRIGAVQAVRVFHAIHLPEHLRGWRLDRPEAGGGVILDITVHDADTVRFLLGEDPAEVVAMSATTGMGQGVEDSAMSVWTMPSGALVQSHEGFTLGFAGTGLEIHGAAGSILARDVMTQHPVGEVLLRTAAGEEQIPFERENLYERSVRRFESAARGEGAPAATGVDGLKSLAVALAVREAAATGRRVAVDYGGF